MPAHIHKCTHTIIERKKNQTIGSKQLKKQWHGFHVHGITSNAYTNEKSSINNYKFQQETEINSNKIIFELV